MLTWALLSEWTYRQFLRNCLAIELAETKSCKRGQAGLCFRFIERTAKLSRLAFTQNSAKNAFLYAQNSAKNALLEADRSLKKPIPISIKRTLMIDCWFVSCLGFGLGWSVFFI
jgi:hypothetical protein